MTTLEIVIAFFGSGVFLSLLGIFYRIGSHHKEIQMSFKHIDERFESIETDLREIRKDVSRIDKEVAVITATLRFNGFDLDRHKAEGE